MDFTFHALAGAAISKELTGKYLIEASIFSILPDVGAIPYKYFKAMSCSKKSLGRFLKDFTMPNKNGNFFGNLDKLVYRSTHSLFSLIPIGLLAFIVSRSYWWILVLSYISHFIIDAFTHEKEFSQMPLYPLLNWSIKGKGWSVNKKVFILSWAGLIFALLLQQGIS